MSLQWTETVDFVNLDNTSHLPAPSQFGELYLDTHPVHAGLYASTTSGQQSPYGDHSRTKELETDNSYWPHMWQFNSGDLGMCQQYPNPYKCASVACSKPSCSSKCCSSLGVCEDDDCAGRGIPCDDMGCLPTSPAEGSGLLDSFMFPPGLDNVPYYGHDGHCDHTNAEHDAAVVLDTLRSQAKPSAQEQFSSRHDVIISGTSSQSLEGKSPSPLGEYHFITQPMTPASQEASGLGTPGTHMCQWITNSEAPEAEKMICRKEFNDSKALEDHLRDIHCAELSSRTGYNCLWNGCARDQGKGFSSGSKLRRHMTTHSTCK
jgi:hypothetical protein